MPSDLRLEESLLQLLDSLEYLETVVDDVFGRIEAKVYFWKTCKTKKNKMSMYFKVAVHRDKVIDVNNRLNVAQAKVLAFFHNQRIDIFIKFYLGSKNSWDSQCDSSIFQVNDQSFLFSVLF